MRSIILQNNRRHKDGICEDLCMDIVIKLPPPNVMRVGFVTNRLCSITRSSFLSLVLVNKIDILHGYLYTCWHCYIVTVLAPVLVLNQPYWFRHEVLNHFLDMVTSCVVGGCTNKVMATAAVGTSVTLHGFPNQKTAISVWFVGLDQKGFCCQNQVHNMQSAFHCQQL